MNLNNTIHTNFTIALPHFPIDIDFVQNQRAQGSHQDFRVCQNVMLSTLQWSMAHVSHCVGGSKGKNKDKNLKHPCKEGYN